MLIKSFEKQFISSKKICQKLIFYFSHIAEEKLFFNR